MCAVYCPSVFLPIWRADDGRLVVTSELCGMSVGPQPMTHHGYRPGALLSHPDHNGEVWTARALLDTNSQRKTGQGWVTNLHPEKNRQPPVRSEASTGRAEPQVSLNAPRGPLLPPLRPPPSVPYLQILHSPHNVFSPPWPPRSVCVLFNLILFGEKVASRRPGKDGNTASVKEGRLQREHTKKFFFKSMVINAIQKEKRKEKLTPQSLKNTAH